MPLYYVFLKHKILLPLMVAMLFISTTLYTLADDINNQVVVGNANPAASAVTVHGSGSGITLTEANTVPVTTSFTASDSNGCSTLANVTVDFFRNGVGTSSCDTAGEADDNNCYPRIACTATTTGNQCTGGADTSVEYDCTAYFLYHADATDAGGGFPADIWGVEVYVADGTATGTSNTVFEVNSLTALDVTPALLDYGAVPAGTDTGNTNSTTTVVNTGNVDMDPQLSGLQLVDGGNTIAVGEQEYSATPFTHGGGTALTGTPATLNITLPQETVSTTTDTISWGINVPGGTPNGTYTGTTTFTATAGI